MSTVNPVTRAILAVSLAVTKPDDARRLCGTFGIPVGHDHATTCDNILAATEEGKALHAVCYVDFVRPSPHITDYRERVFRSKYEQGRGDENKVRVDYLVPANAAPQYAPAPVKPTKAPAKGKAKAKGKATKKAPVEVELKKGDVISVP